MYIDQIDSLMPIMNHPTWESSDGLFVKIAVQHGLLDRDRVDDLLRYANEHDVKPSDGALSLAFMQPWEVEATELLTQPLKLAPGYHLTGLIGSGAAGIVFRASQSALKREVALKTINLHSRGQSTGESRIQVEAQSIARLRHPNIVTAYDSGLYHGRFCIAMELVEGETLAELIEREGPLPEEKTWHIVRQVSAALAHADSCGITHRDIKPANILLCTPPDGTQLPRGVPYVKVADFGLARDEHRLKESKLTETGSTLGTPAYVAPEQLQDTAVDRRADIYALGATAFHMLVGEAPYANQSPMKAILQKTIGDDRWRDKLPNSISSASALLCRQMTETDPLRRPATYTDLLQEIDSLLENERRQASSVGQHSYDPFLSADTQDTARISTLDTGSPKQRMSKTAAAGIATVLIVLAALITRHWISDSGERKLKNRIGPSESNRSITWKPAGLPQPLFNGRSIPVGTVASTGWWTPEAALDGSRVLAGHQGSVLRITLRSPGAASPNAQLQININLPNNESIVQITKQSTDIAGNDVEELPGSLVIHDSEARYYEETPQSSSDQANSTAQSVLELTRSIPSDVLFRRIRVIREGNMIRTQINEHELEPQSCNAEGEVSVVVRCVRGRVNVADLTIVELVPE